MSHKSIIADFLLFDLDGTLVNSTLAVEKTWIEQCNNHNSTNEVPIDAEILLNSAHGTRTAETIKRWFPYLQNDKDSINLFEKAIVTNYGHLAEEVKGATHLIDGINKFGSDQWAIITSGTKDLAYGWFEKLFVNSGKPKVFITANDVSQGKPNPEGYLKAFSQLKETNKLVGHEFSAVVFEDAPVGIQAGIAAGFHVIGIATTFDKDALIKAGSSFVVEDLSKIHITKTTSTSFQLDLDIL